MGLVKDEVGHRYERLLVIARAGSQSHKATWLCLCDCGKTIEVSGDVLRQGHQKSCGCYRKEDAQMRFTTHGQSNAGGINGKKCSRTYKSWQEMWRRCTIPDHVSYKNYGAKGVTVNPSWSSFEAFYGDMGDRPQGMSLDRIDGSVGYCKENCKWSTRLEQNQNRSICHLVTIGGETLVLSEWCRRFNVGYFKAYHRIVMKGLDPLTVLENLPKLETKTLETA